MNWPDPADWIGDNERPLVVVLTGAGISAESGIPTFRDANGLWEGHDVMAVATPEGFAKNPELVLRFYNIRREAAQNAQPNAGHLALVALEQHYNVVIVTQNVDDLHERAGSSKVLHLHGELSKVRSTAHPELVYDIGGKHINVGDMCERGAQLRPHIVWFGEDVPLFPVAEAITNAADFFIVVGTSLVVYPAASLLHSTRQGVPVFVVNPDDLSLPRGAHLLHIKEPGTTGVPKVVKVLVDKAQLAH